MKASIVVCEECEGTGKAVNYFDFPKDYFDLSQPKAVKFINNKKYRSDGREFYDHECSVCQGKGRRLRFG